MTRRLQRLFPACILCGCFLFSHKAHAFDYGKYDKQHKQIRSIPPSQNSGGAAVQGKQENSHAFQMFANQLLEAMQNDAVPAKFFDAGSNLSFYFKPAKITKIGFKYKF